MSYDPDNDPIVIAKRIINNLNSTIDGLMLMNEQLTERLAFEQKLNVIISEERHKDTDYA